MNNIYLDNSATTQVFPEVAELMTEIMCRDYGNPSSMHNKGIEAENHIKEALKIISKTLKVNEKEILFTSCGTEADNMALIGVARANMRRGKHLITTKIEHPAILNAMKQLEEEGFEVTYLNVDGNGIVKLDELKNAIRPDTILVSVMNVNNEIGSVQPIKEIGKMIKTINPNTYFHVDDVQGYGKIRLNPKKMNIDLLSVSAHKIHGPKGMGFLYIANGTRIFPILYGGGQQNGLRSGTENVPGIAGMALAADRMHKEYDKDVIKMYFLKRHFANEVSKIEGVSVNGIPNLGADNTVIDNEEVYALIENGDRKLSEEEIEILVKEYACPHIISVSIEDVRAEVMLHSLEDKGIYVSAGSACSTHKRTPSATLTAINLEKKLMESTIRFSLSVLNEKEDIDETVRVMKEIIPLLRRYTRK